MSDLDGLYLSAVETVLGADIWHEQSWHAIIRLAPDPTAAPQDAPLLHGSVPAAELCAVVSLQDLAEALKRPVAEMPAHPYAYIPLLFPTSPAVATVALAYARVGAGPAAKQLLGAATRFGSALPTVWLSYASMLERSKAPAASRVKALRAALDEVGSDPRAGALWEQLAKLLEEQVGVALQQTPPNLEGAGAVMKQLQACVFAGLAQPLSKSNVANLRKSLGAAEAILSRAGGPAAVGVPAAVEECVSMAAAVAAKELALLPPELSFPGPIRGAVENDEHTSDSWHRYQLLLKAREGNPMLILDDVMLRRSVDLFLQQLCARTPRSEAAFVLRSMALQSLGDAKGAANALKLALELVPSSCLLIRRMVADGAADPVEMLRKLPDDLPSDAIARMPIAAEALARTDIASSADAGKSAKKAFRAVGKASVAAKVDSWEAYASWGDTELSVLGDHSLLQDIARRGIALASSAATGRTREHSLANFTALCRSVASWARQRQDELEVRSTLKRSVQMCTELAERAPVATMREAWLSLADAEANMRGQAAADSTDAARVATSAKDDEEVAVRLHRGAMAWGATAQTEMALRVAKQCGGTLPLPPAEARLWQMLSDVEASALLNPDDRCDLDPWARRRLVPHLPLEQPAAPLNPAVAAATTGAQQQQQPAAAAEPMKWKRMAKLPVNTHPAKESDDQNTDELCAPRAMKPVLKFVPDSSVQAMRVWRVQRAANPDMELLPPAGAEHHFQAADDADVALAGAGEAGSSSAVRLAPQLQSLFEVCRGLPALAKGAMEVDPDWLIEQLVREPLDLRFDAAADQAKRKAHRRELHRTADMHRAGKSTMMGMSGGRR